MGVFSHSGSRVICFFFPAGPTIAVRNSSASSFDRGSSWPINSENDGTVLSLSLKYVGRRWGGGSGVEASVARDREVEEAWRKVRAALRSGGAFSHLNLLTVAAILYINF